jgi:hypothetical protein
VKALDAFGILEQREITAGSGAGVSILFLSGLNGLCGICFFPFSFLIFEGVVLSASTCFT